MISKFAPHLEVLPPSQRDVWENLAPACKLGFVLYGGTAVALRLGHRSSVDFDFFSQHHVRREAIVSALPFLAQAKLLQDQPDTSTFLISAAQAPVKISFFGGIHHGRVGAPQWTDDEIMQVASLDDLMATKIKTVMQRIEAKDYRDIAAMLRAGVSLPRALASASQMYGSANFQPSESLKALVYFKGGDLENLPDEDKRILVEAAGAVRDLPRVETLSKVLALSS